LHILAHIRIGHYGSDRSLHRWVFTNRTEIMMDLFSEGDDLADGKEHEFLVRVGVDIRRRVSQTKPLHTYVTNGFAMVQRSGATALLCWHLGGGRGCE